MPHRKWILLVCAVSTLIWLTSCAETASGPKVGTSEYYWTAAVETFKTGDYVKAGEHLDRVSRSDSPLAAKARPWNLVLRGGLASGYTYLEDTYELGSKVFGINKTPFVRQISQYQKMADQYATDFAEAFLTFRSAHQDPDVSLAFSYPTGSASPSPDLSKVGKGYFPSESDLAKVEDATLKRGVLLAACEAVGAADDTAKAVQYFSMGEVRVPKDVFLLAMAKKLDQLSEVYDSKHRDKPAIRAKMQETALEVAKSLPESKETKALIQKLEKAMKGAGKRAS